jgi:O-antigen ligase
MKDFTDQRVHRLDSIAGLLVFAPVIVLPWLQGGTNPASLPASLVALIGGWVVWVGVRLAQTGRVRIPRWLGLAVGVVGAVAVWHLWSDVATLADSGIRLHHRALRERWPNSFVRLSSDQKSLLWMALAAALVPMVDLLRRNRGWMQILVGIHAVNGALIAGEGLVCAEKYEGCFFGDRSTLTGMPFGPFFHYSLAAGYFLSCLPGALLLAFGVSGGLRGTFSQRDRSKAVLLWLVRRLMGMLVLGLLTAALLVNQAAAAQLAAIGAVVLFLGVIWLARVKPGKRIRPNQVMVGGVGAALVLALMTITWGVGDPHIALGSLEQAKPLPEGVPKIVDRGDLMLPSTHPQRGLWAFERRLAWATALELVPEAGFFGWGPGNWAEVYPSRTSDLFLLSFFLHVQFVHNDALQWLIEWGWLGGVAWLVILFGGALHGSRLVWNRWWKGSLSSGNRLCEAGGAIALLAVLLHSQVDFPLQCPAVLASALLCCAVALASPMQSRSGKGR